MGKNLSILLTYTFGHFYIDFICSLILSLIIFKNPTNVSQIALLIILYNLIAFGTQPFFGFLADKYKKAQLSAITGIIITTAGMIFFFNPTIAVILLGIGNALYHVGGGIVVLNLNPGKAKYPGIYVSTGALGLFLGGLLGYIQVNPWLFIIGGVLVSGILISIIQVNQIQKIKKFKERKVSLIGIVSLLLLVSVCMRSLISDSLKLSWKSAFILGLILTLSVVLGKFFGGILADKYGFMKVGIIGLLIATPLLTFFQSIPILVFIGVFCFNLVMPITLTAIAEVFPNYKGFAFGLTTLALVVGYLLFMWLRHQIIIGIWFTLIVILINIISLYFGLRKYEEMKT